MAMGSAPHSLDRKKGSLRWIAASLVDSHHHLVSSVFSLLLVQILRQQNPNL